MKKDKEAKAEQEFYSIEQVSENTDVNVAELDMNNLIQQKNEDILEIERLQKLNEEYSQRITVRDVNKMLGNSFAGGLTQGGTEEPNPNEVTTESQRLRINGMMEEIGKNTKEIEMLKQKL